jgi:hypothetical protein
VSSDSTRKPRSRKAADRPKKPFPEFPLSPLPSGAWQKKINGKIHYFGNRQWAPLRAVYPRARAPSVTNTVSPRIT